MSQNFSKILIAPLDWGLGHAARCIPLINMFLNQDKEVAIASSGGALAMLKKEFPELTFYELPPYNIHYEYSSMVVNMILQLPKMRSVMLKENRAVAEILNDFDADLIISDNRYGVYSPVVPSVFMGHQLAIQLPKKIKAFSKLALKWHESMLRPFNQIWVPDFNVNPNLSGKLSHRVKMNKQLHFIGPLSRFNYSDDVEEDLALLIMISGQEPRRTQFEERVIAMLSQWKEKVVLLRGLPAIQEELQSPYENLKIYNHLPTEEIEILIKRAKRIVCRSGYSSVMDFAALHKRVLFIPTKGQTEQEYLARYLSKTGRALSSKENLTDLMIKLNRLGIMRPLILENNRLEFLVNHAMKKLK